MHIRGSKGGGSSTPKQPYVAPDTVRSVAKAKLLYALTEGEAEGLADGLASVKLNGTPVYDSNGNPNIPGVRIEFRPGTVNQSYIQGFPETNNEISVGTELRFGTPWVRASNNPDLSAVRVRVSWDRLLQQLSNGDTVGVRIEYAIDVATDGGAYETMLTAVLDDKSESKYERSHRINLPAGSGWLVRVRRLTPNADSLQVADRMVVSAITEVIDAKLRYPHVALLAVEYDSEHFNGSIAKISVDLKGRRILVPANYDPVARTYATNGPGTTNGVWDGTFKEAYSNNPAWVWYDVALNHRYGLGRRIDASMINRWKLYQIAQYCDVMVADGKGGLEPRYTCNLYLQSRKPAYVILSEIASIFHGASFWDGSQLVVNADMPADPVYTYTRASIIEGEINYKGTGGKNRHSIAMVAWDDPAQGYETMYEPVVGDMNVRDVRQLDIGAIGATSSGQAQRAGLWALKTEQTETRLPVFRVGLDGQIPRPGDIIALADELLAGRPNGGRIAWATNREVAFDREAPVKAGDRLVVNLPSGRSQSRQVQSASLVDGKTVVRVVATYDEVPNPESVWAIDADDLAVMLFRVTGIARPEFHQFEISGVRHIPGKFPAIDNGAKIEFPPISVIPPGVQAPPTNVRITQGVKVEQTMAITTMTIAWDSVANAIGYDVEWRKDSGDWVRVPRTGGLNVDIVGVYTGQYLARVRAVNAINVLSIPASSMLTDIVGKTGAPPSVAYLTTTALVFGIRLDWGFLPGSDDTQRTEIEYSLNANGAGALRLGDFAYPLSTSTMMGLAAGVRFWFRARLVDRTGNIGPWNNWTQGDSSSDATAILEYIVGKIRETHLGAELLGRINSTELSVAQLLAEVGLNDEAIKELIDQGKLLSDGLLAEATKRLEQYAELAEQATANAAAISQEKADRLAQAAVLRSEIEQQVEVIESQISELLGTEDYSATKDYVAGDLVKFNYKLYRAKVATKGNPPSSTTHWLLLGDYTSIGQAVGDLSTRVTTVQAVAADNATKIGNLQTADGQTQAKINNLQSTQSGQATQLNQLSVKANQNESKISDLEDVTQGQATRLSTVETKTDTNVSQIGDLQTTTADQATRLVNLGTTVSDQGSSINGLQQTQTALAISITQLVTKTDTTNNEVSTLFKTTAEMSILLTELRSTQGDSDGSIKELSETSSEHARMLQRLDVTDGQTKSNIVELYDVTATQAGRLTSVETQSSDSANKVSQLLTTTDQLSSLLTTLGTTTGQSAAAITALQQTQAAQATSITQLVAKDTEFENRITTLQQADLEKSIQLTQLLSESGSADASFTQIFETQAGLSRATTLLTANFELNAAAIRVVSEAVASETEARATQYNGLNTRVGENAAAIGSTSTALATLTTSVGTLRTEMVSRTNANQASVSALSQTVTTETTALSERINSVRADVGNNFAVIEDVSRAMVGLDSRLSATRALRVGVSSGGLQYVAGMGLGVENTDRGWQSQVVFLADRMTLITEANGIQYSPWSVENGQVFITQAFIGNLDASKVTFGQMFGDRIQVGTLNADRLWTPSLSAKLAEIDTAYIRNAHLHWASVGTLQIAGQSVITHISQDFPSTGYSRDALNYPGWIDLFQEVWINIPEGGFVMGVLATSGGTNINKHDPQQPLGRNEYLQFGLKHMSSGWVIPVGNGSGDNYQDEWVGKTTTVIFPNLGRGFHGFRIVCNGLAPRHTDCRATITLMGCMR